MSDTPLFCRSPRVRSTTVSPLEEDAGAAAEGVGPPGAAALPGELEGATTGGPRAMRSPGIAGRGGEDGGGGAGPAEPGAAPDAAAEAEEGPVAGAPSRALRLVASSRRALPAPEFMHASMRSRHASLCPTAGLFCRQASHPGHPGVGPNVVSSTSRRI